MVSAQTLAYIRSVTADFLTDTCTLARENATVDRYGSPAGGEVVLTVDVPCRLIKSGQFNTGSGQIVGSQDTLQDTYKLIVAHDTTIDVDYLVTVGGEQFSVVRLETDLTDKVFKSAIMARRR